MVRSTLIQTHTQISSLSQQKEATGRLVNCGLIRSDNFTGLCTSKCNFSDWQCAYLLGGSECLVSVGGEESILLHDQKGALSIE